MKTSKKEVKKVTEEKYTKDQIVNSKTFINNRDLLRAVLKEDKSYSKKEINEIIEKLCLKVTNETVRKAVVKMGYVYKKKSLYASECYRP